MTTNALFGKRLNLTTKNTHVKYKLYYLLFKSYSQCKRFVVVETVTLIFDHVIELLIGDPDLGHKENLLPQGRHV